MSSTQWAARLRRDRSEAIRHSGLDESELRRRAAEDNLSTVRALTAWRAITRIDRALGNGAPSAP